MINIKYFKKLFKSGKCFCGEKKLTYNGKVCSDYCLAHELEQDKKIDSRNDELDYYRIQE